jgi:D-glycero-D-manno-heptose 1,7-bisphosphate phosphatase
MSSDLHKAVFLDRDGVINEERGQYTWQPEDFRINAGVFDALRRLQDEGYLLIIISNQGGIAKGLYSKADFDRITEHMYALLLANGIRIEETYFCPHHPDFGRCICRKPDSLLLEKAIARFRIDTGQSWFIGDASRDEAAGKSAGLRTVLIRPNSDLGEAVTFVLGNR